MIRKQEKLNQKHKHARKSRHDGANNGSDGQAVEGCVVVLLFVCVFVGGHRGAFVVVWGSQASPMPSWSV
ncbi:hypothetical protein, partial [Cutibacterium acnes]|uniref:hypothetical protein n=1 Tax=Cutibacterium acnes TaxID=1747 RepID=UPI0032B80D23